MEVKTMQRLVKFKNINQDHPHIVHMYECYEEAEYIYMILEY